MYVAYRKCGCIQGAVFAEEGEGACRKMSKKYVSMWVKDGCKISTIEDGEELVWFCEQHKEAVQ